MTFTTTGISRLALLHRSKRTQVWFSLLLLPSIIPSIRVFSNESILLLIEIFQSNFLNLLLAMLGLRCCARLAVAVASGGYSLIADRGLLSAVTSLVAEHGSMLPMQGAKVLSLVRELDPTCCNYHAGESPLLSRSGGEKGLRGSGAARGSSQPRDRTWVSCIAGRFFTS